MLVPIALPTLSAIDDDRQPALQRAELSAAPEPGGI
jgi:hypothetical protein